MPSLADERSPAIDQTILALIADHGVPLVLLMIFIGELGVPTIVPVEIALLLVGSHAVSSFPALLAALGLVTLADLLGTTILHLTARTGGVRLLRHLPGGHAVRCERLIERWRERLGGHEAITIFIARLLPIGRMCTALGAGLIRIRFRSFLLGAAPAALLWAGTPLVVRYFFRGEVRRIEARYTQVAHAALLILPLAALLGALIWWVRRGGPPIAQVRRGHCALGLVAALTTVTYLIRTGWTQDEVAAAIPGLLTWPAVLAGLAAILLGLALADLHGLAVTRGAPIGRSPRGGVEVARTTAWVTAVAAAGAVVLGLEAVYPAL